MRKALCLILCFALSQVARKNGGCVAPLMEEHAMGCPIFMHYKEAIAQDFDLEAQHGRPPTDRQIIEAMKSHWSMRRLGHKTHLCRFADYTKSAKDLFGDGQAEVAMPRVGNNGLAERSNWPNSPLPQVALGGASMATWKG